MSDDKSEPRFDSSAEQVGGSYDQGTAESRALVHAQKKFGRRWFRKLPLIWATESSHYNEDVDRWEIVVSCHPLRDEKNRGEWVYHISPDGRKVLPGTPLLRSQLQAAMKQPLPRPTSRVAMKQPLPRPTSRVALKPRRKRSKPLWQRAWFWVLVLMLIGLASYYYWLWERVPKSLSLLYLFLAFVIGIWIKDRIDGKP